MNLDTFKIFAFVRQDLPIEQQMVQAIHATFHASLNFSGIWQADGFMDGIPYVVLIGVPDLKALRRVEKKLNDNHIRHNSFIDTDIDQAGPSTICTVPLPPEQAKLLASYRLWRYSGHPVAAVSKEASNTGENLNVQPGANAAVAQTPFALRCE